MQNIEKELDKLFQQLSNRQKCWYCPSPATASHHLVGRSNLNYRWDWRNSLPVCYSCHHKLHFGGLKNPPFEATKTSWHGVKTKEFMQEKKRELLHQLKNNLFDK